MLVLHTKLLKQLLGDNAGATAVEYGLIISLIVLAIIGALQSVAGNTLSMWGRVETAVSTVVGG